MTIQGYIAHRKRKNRNLSMKQVADLAGYDKSIVSRLENGREISRLAAMDILQALNREPVKRL